MKWARAVLFATMTAFAGAIVLPASAAPPSDLTEREKPLYALVKTEIETVRAFVDIFGEGIRRKDVELSAAAKSAHSAAKAHYDTCVKHHDAGRYKKGYAECREAHDDLKPAIVELLEKENAPEGLIKAIGSQISESSRQISGIEPSVKGAPPEGKAAHARATELHDKAKRQWENGKRKEGFITLHSALVELDKAVRITWPEAS